MAIVRNEPIAITRCTGNNRLTTALKDLNSLFLIQDTEGMPV